MFTAFLKSEQLCLPTRDSKSRPTYARPGVLYSRQQRRCGPSLRMDRQLVVAGVSSVAAYICQCAYTICNTVKLIGSKLALGGKVCLPGIVSE